MCPPLLPFHGVTGLGPACGSRVAVASGRRDKDPPRQAAPAPPLGSRGPETRERAARGGLDPRVREAGGGGGRCPRGPHGVERGRRSLRAALALPLPPGQGDPDGPGPAVLCQHADRQPLGRPAEAPGHRTGAGEQPTCHVLRRAHQVFGGWWEDPRLRGFTGVPTAASEGACPPRRPRLSPLLLGVPCRGPARPSPVRGQPTPRAPARTQACASGAGTAWGPPASHGAP